MHKTLDEVCLAIDELTLRNLELMEEKISVNVQLEEILRDGYIEMAKARYIRGKESIGILQVPTEEGQFESLFDLHTTVEGDNGSPHFEISAKKLNREGVNPQDPIKWFGVLVPQNLKNAQKRFQAALQMAVRNANIHAEIQAIPEQLENLKDLKCNLTQKEE